jgi:Flp pilus assembly pilin Flp
VSDEALQGVMNGMPLAPSVLVWRLYWFLHRGTEEERESVASEYGLLLALIALAMVAAAALFGVAVAHLFDQGRSGIP